MPPVSSLTTIMSAPSTISLERRCVCERRIHHGRSQVGEGVELLSEREQPCLGLLRVLQVLPFGSPDRPMSTASDSRAFLSTSSVTGTPWASIELPPNRSFSNSKSISCFFPRISSIARLTSVTSTPIPSPGSISTLGNLILLFRFFLRRPYFTHDSFQEEAQAEDACEAFEINKAGA